MAGGCRGCKKGGNPGSSSGSGGRKLAAHTPGNIVKLRYLGGSNELVAYEGVATRTEYVVGGKINLIDVYASDTAQGISWAPGLLEMRGEDGKRLFKVHVPLKEEIEAEARALEMKEEAWKNAEALALPPEPEPVEPEVANGEDSVPGD